MIPKAKQEYENRIRPGGILLIDSSGASDKLRRDDIKVHCIPASKLAAELGSPQAANLIMLGAYLEITQALPLEAVGKRLAGRKRERFLEINREALSIGAKLVTVIHSCS